MVWRDGLRHIPQAQGMQLRWASGHFVSFRAWISLSVSRGGQCYELCRCLVLYVSLGLTCTFFPDVVKASDTFEGHIGLCATEVGSAWLFAAGLPPLSLLTFGCVFLAGGLGERRYEGEPLGCPLSVMFIVPIHTFFRQKFWCRKHSLNKCGFSLKSCGMAVPKHPRQWRSSFLRNSFGHFYIHFLSFSYFCFFFQKNICRTTFLVSLYQDSWLAEMGHTVSGPVTQLQKLLEPWKGAGCFGLVLTPRVNQR